MDKNRNYALPYQYSDIYTIVPSICLWNSAQTLINLWGLPMANRR